MDNILVVNKYFRATSLDDNTILLTTKLPFISEYNVPYCIAAIESHYYTNKKIILDLSQIDYIDSTSIHLLHKKITEITSHGSSINLLISKIKPTISYSIGDPVTELNKYFILHTVEKATIN